jgi:hypothetical protein
MHIKCASGSIAWEQTPGAEDGCHHHHANVNSTRCPEREKEGKVNRKIVSKTLKTFFHAGMTQHEVVWFMVGLQCPVEAMF